jgi:sodium transport system ATP-binding protein
MVTVKDLTKVYTLTRKQRAVMKTQAATKVAVDGVSFTAQPGRIFGLLGPNGAGKTTTLRCLATLLKPTGGQILVDGLDVAHQADEVRRRIGFLTNELKLDDHFSARYTLGFFGRLHGLTEQQIAERERHLFDTFGVTDFAEMKIGQMSTGMKQKLAIAVSLVHDPDVVVFDEPTNGLDIITARLVTDYLKELRDQGKTVIISTHIMTVAEKLCDTIGILLEGKLAAFGSLTEILAEADADDLDDAFFTIYKRMQEASA